MAQKTATLLPEVQKSYGDLKNFIGGKWVPSTAAEWLDDTDPATGERIARVPLSPREDIDAAVQAGDRIEIYRAIVADPKTTPRRRLAEDEDD